MQTHYINQSIFSRTFYFQLISLFILLVLVLGGNFYSRQKTAIDNQNQLILSNEKERLKLIKHIARFHIDEFISDAYFLSKGETLSRFIISRKPHIDKVHVEKEFVTLARERKKYDQIRYLNAQGKELVRINYNHGDPSITPERYLQDKSGRYYFQDSFNTNQGQIYISPLDLNKEQGKIELPYKPMIRVGTVVVDGYNHKKGVLLLNFYGQKILTEIEQLLSGSAGETMMLNNKGYWLLNSDKDKLWGFMYNNDKTLGIYV